jgi:FAD/FMN-containing dehydrogenase
MKPAVLSWGRYPGFPQTPRALSWRSQVQPSLVSLRRSVGSTLAYGNGRSYGDSCLAVSGQVLAMRGLDKFILADWERGVVVVEPGLTLGELLSVAIPRGWFLRVTPGTQFVTVGGAIANDVHGKNHHQEGTFGCHVPRFGLLRSMEGELECSADQNASLYAATIGGLGLTGVIVWAEVQLRRIRSSGIKFVTQRFDSIEEFFSLSNELDTRYEFCVAWVDCTARGSSSGRGIYSAGEFEQEGVLAASRPGRLAIPWAPPFSVVNSVSLRLFNEVYWRKNSQSRREGRVDYGPFLYPLDGVKDWNRIYGRAGFQQYQCALPPDAAPIAVASLLSAIAKSGMGSFLAVLKRFGDRRSPGLLSFPVPGVTLALDFQNGSHALGALFERLDSIVREAGGRLYPAKDAHMRAADFRSAYPQWQLLESLRDPALNSRFWSRVTQ